MDFAFAASQKLVPLGHRLRPQTLADYVGQEQLVGKDKILQKMIEQGTVSSLIFWGPPGSGKTTLGRCVLRLIEPSRGQILLDGEDIRGLHGDRLLALRRPR